MNVEMSRANASETPASTMTNSMCEHVAALMVLGGIESIVLQKYASGFGSRVHVTIAPFSRAPEAVKTVGIVIKDAVAQILSVANITRLVLKPTEDEMINLMSTWKKSTEDALMANAGSGQDFTPKGKGVSR